MSESRFRREDFEEHLDWQNAVYAAYEADPKDPDPAVQWMANMLDRVAAYERGEIKAVKLTGMSWEERRRLLFGG